MANLQSGAAGFTPEPSGKLYLGSDQLSLVSGASTVVQLDTVAPNFTDGIENTGTYKITPGAAGLYLCIAQVRFKSVVADKHYFAAILQSGSTYIVRGQGHSSLAQDIIVPASTPYWFNNTDYVELRVVQWAGVDTVGIQSSERDTFMAVQRLR